MKNIKIIVAAVVFIVCGIVFSCSRSDEVTDLSQMPTEAEEDAAENSTDRESLKDAAEDSLEGTEPGCQEETERATCFVYVCGAVERPGVIKLEDGSRITDAIDAAGGVTDGAAPEYLNLAEPVYDGEKIYVPTEEDMAADGASALIQNSGSSGLIQGSGASAFDPKGSVAKEEDSRVNINTATAEQLKALSGIGDKKAADIINYRESHGNFKSIEDIMKVPGIKNAAFEKIKDNITV